MKNWNIILALLILGILIYGAFVYFWIWLFFIDEPSFSYTLGGLFVVGMLIALGGGFISAAFSYEQLPKTISVLGSVFGIAIAIIGGIMVITPILYFFLVPLYLAIKHLCYNASIPMFVGLIWLCVILVMYLLMRYNFRITLNVTPILRTVFYRLIQYFSIYAIIISAIYIPSADSIGYGNIIIGTMCLDSAEYGMVLLTILFVSLAFGVTMEGVASRIFYVTIPKIKYNFFLRPFYKDSYLEIDDEIKKYFPDELVEIANPITKYGNESFNGSSFFLPVKDWKRELEYYIRRANLVFCCIGHSDGVKWEMFEHDEQLHKFIFYNDGIVSCDNIIESVGASNYASSKVYNALCRIGTIDISGRYYFIVRDNICLYSTNLSTIASYVINDVKEDDLLEFEFGNQINNISDNSLGDSYKRVRFRYLIKDILRIMSIVFRPKALSAYLLVILAIADGIMKLALLLLGIGLIIVGVALLLSFLWPSLRDGLGFTSMKEVIGYGIGAIILGIGMMKNWKD